MAKNNNIEEVLIEAGCDPGNIERLVKSLCHVMNGDALLPAGIAVAIYLKSLAQRLCDDNDADTNLAVLLHLSDAYNVDISSRYRIIGGTIMNDIENMLIENDCDPETIATIVNDIKTVADEHSMLQVSIALAILLKVFTGGGTDDRDEQLKMIFAIADCYDINID
jgi:hypothetical protein